MLDVPAKDDLRYRFADAAGDLGQRWVTEHFALRDRRPGFGHDPVRLAVLVDLPVLEVRVELDLVHGRHHVPFGGEALEMRNLEVRDADRPRPAVLLELLKRLPGRHEVAVVERRQGPVDEEQVDVVEAERRERLVERAPRSVGLVEAIVQLARDVDLRPIEPGRAHRVPDSAFVAVHLGGIDVAVAGAERSCSRRFSIGRRHLEYAEAELGNRVAVVEADRRNCAHAGGP